MTTYDQIFSSVVSGDMQTISQHFEGEWDREEILGKKDEAGRNMLAVASMLGRSAIVRELVKHGAQVNEQTARGYSPLHFAACWGHVDTVRTLLELGANIQVKTFRGEIPVDLARKYSKTDCADCLTLADAKQDLMSYVAFIQDKISDSDGNFTREEKNTCIGVCSAISNWIQSCENPTVSDYIAQRQDTEDKLQSILSKMSAQNKD